MAISISSTVWKGVANSTNSKAVTVAPTAGHCLVVVIWTYPNTSLPGNHGVSDNIDGTTGWSKKATLPVDAAGVSGTVWVKFGIPSGIVTVTVSGDINTSLITTIIHEITGVDAFTTGEVYNAIFSATANPQSGAITNATPNSIFLSFVQVDVPSGTGTFTPNSTGSSPTGWALASATNSKETDANNNLVGAVAYLIVSSSASTVHGWTTDNDTGNQAVIVLHPTGGASYTLTAAVATYTETGVAAGLKVGHKIPATVAAYTLTGIAANLYKGKTLVATTATYAETGIAAGLLWKRRLVATVQTYALTGIAVTLTKSGGRTMTATPATYVFMSGKHYTTDFPATENPISESGKWTNGATDGVDWKDVQTNGTKAYGTQSGAPGFDDSTAVLTGTWGADQDCTAIVRTANQQTSSNFEEVEIRLRSIISAHVNSGYEVNFRCTHDGTQYIQIVRWNGPINDFAYVDTTTGPGIYDGDVVRAKIVGSVITVYVNGIQVLSASDSVFTTGNPGVGFFFQSVAGAVSDYGFGRFRASDTNAVQLDKGYKLTATVGTYTETGIAAGLRFGRTVSAAVATYTLSGIAVNFRFTHVMPAVVTAYTLTGRTVNLLFGHKVAASVGSFTLTGIAVNLFVTPFSGNYTLPTTTAAYLLTGIPATLTYSGAGPVIVPKTNAISAWFVEDFGPRKKKRPQWIMGPNNRMVRVEEPPAALPAPVTVLIDPPAQVIETVTPTTIVEIKPDPLPVRILWTDEQDADDLRAIAKLLSTLH